MFQSGFSDMFYITFAYRLMSNPTNIEIMLRCFLIRSVDPALGGQRHLRQAGVRGRRMPEQDHLRIHEGARDVR